MNILMHITNNLLLIHFLLREKEKKKKKLREVQVKQVDGQEVQINDESG